MHRHSIFLAIFAWTLACLCAGIASPALARNDPAQICDRAALRVANETGVPLDVLRAITRTETGRKKGTAMQPWPWTVNMEGDSVWFDSEGQAQTFVFRHFRAGARSFDIGCFQINYKWHGHAFASIEEMFDPLRNARYAARFLQDLHAELGDWTEAVGAYHSRTAEYARRYLARYADIHRALPDIGAPSGFARQNRFPLLAGQVPSRGRGSLVPLSGGVANRLINLDSGG